MPTITPPETTNQAATFLNNLISAFLQGGETAAQAYIVAQLPIFANPILGYFLSLGLGYIENELYTVMAIMATNMVIDFQTNGENSAVLQAAQEMQAAQASGDASAIATAQADLIAAYGNLVHSDGSAVT